MTQNTLPSRLGTRLRNAGLLLAASAALIGCKEEETEPTKLFEEEGAYEITFYSLDGGGVRPINPTNRAEAFLLKFDATNNVVQTAMCGEDEESTPEDSLCRLAPTGTSWFCSCFSYAFEDDTMVWQEFNAGDPPPPVTIDGTEPLPAGTGGDTDTAGTGTGGGATGTAPPAEGGPATVLVGEVQDIASTYVIGPLPEGIFGSDGVTSSYQMLRKADSLFDQVYEDPQGRGVCVPCI